ncbi:YezD family protein [Novosphingobium sp.]|uniref:YezD family protein n=1 Tax=Novosphingobium sp. TaxID=1874826 RepID=UPI002610563C|nr:YezD family protein [Novosphingobium sp.]
MAENDDDGRPRSGPPENQIEESLASVREALTGLKFGSIQLTVHEGRVVQIDVTEKRRIKPS